MNNMIHYYLKAERRVCLIVYIFNIVWDGRGGVVWF